jgi:hypothetical protein
MKPASALAAILALISLPLLAQDRDAEFIRTVRQLPANVLDPVVFPVATSFEQVFSIHTRVPAAALEWRVNDCGEGGDGRKAPTCVEARAELAPDVVVKAMERMVLAVAAMVTWKPVTSGIRGSASWKSQGESWRPRAGLAIQVHADDKQGFHISTGDDGSFWIPLAPGAYRIEPMVFGAARSNPSQTVVVRPDGFVDASFSFDRGTGNTTFPGSGN